MRWEPYFGQNVRNGVISVFNMDNFQKNVKSKVFLKAPAGLIYAGDAGFPNNAKTGMNKQWWNLSPRGGFAWDVHGDGRLAVARRTRWPTTSWRASTTTSTPTRRRSATARS